MAVYDCPQVHHLSVKGGVGRIAVRQSSAPGVIAYNHPLGRHAFVPATKIRNLPFQLDVAVRWPWHLHEGITLAHRPIGYAHAVLGLGVLDTRFHQSHTTSCSRIGFSNPFSPASPLSMNVKPLPAANCWTTSAASIC